MVFLLSILLLIMLFILLSLIMLAIDYINVVQHFGQLRLNELKFELKCIWMYTQFIWASTPRSIVCRANSHLRSYLIMGRFPVCSAEIYRTELLLFLYLTLNSFTFNMPLCGKSQFCYV